VPGMSHPRIALITIISALVLDAALGLAFAAAQHIAWWLGLYCALANAVTVGGTVVPSTPAGYAVTAAECALVVPLFAATFSLFTSSLSAVHVRLAEAKIKAHLEDRLAAHHKAIAAGPDGQGVAASVARLRDEVGDLADATRAVLAARTPAPTGEAAAEQARAANAVAEIRDAQPASRKLHDPREPRRM
jgi:hypothetical protein